MGKSNKGEFFCWNSGASLDIVIETNLDDNRDRALVFFTRFNEDEIDLIIKTSLISVCSSEDNLYETIVR